MNALAHPSWPDRRAPVAGWGISLLAHALAVAWLLHAWHSDRPAPDAAPAHGIEVRLLSPPPPPRLRAAPVAAPMPHAAARPPRPAQETDADAVAPGRPSASARATAPARVTPARVIDAPASPVADVPPTDVPAAPADRPAPAATGDAAPRVDRAAARDAARQFGRNGGKSLVAYPERKLVVDPNADRRVVDPLEAARRPDCQSVRGQSTNLLANVVMLAVDLTKNAIDDSGCKW